MPRNRDVCTAYLSYLLRTCDVCVAYPRLSFRIYGVSATYVWRISRINGVCATYVSLLWSKCDVLGVLGIFCGIPRKYLMLLYKYFRFSEIMDQMFLTGRGSVQGSFRATLGVASVFIHDILRPGRGAWICPPAPYPLPSVFSSVLIRRLSRFLQWHLRPLIIDNCNVRIAGTN